MLTGGARACAGRSEVFDVAAASPEGEISVFSVHRTGRKHKRHASLHAGTSDAGAAPCLAFCSPGVLAVGGGRMKRDVHVCRLVEPARRLPTAEAQERLPAQVHMHMPSLQRWSHVAAVHAVAASPGVVVTGSSDGLVHTLTLRHELREPPPHDGAPA